MIADNETVRKRPYVLLPVVPAEDGGVPGESTPALDAQAAGAFRVQVAFQEVMLRGALDPEPLRPAAETVGDRPATSPSLLLDLLVAVVPSLAGAGLAYFLADNHGVDPMAWSALGGGAGLLLGWGCLLWIRRGS